MQSFVRFGTYESHFGDNRTSNNFTHDENGGTVGTCDIPKESEEMDRTLGAESDSDGR